MKTKEILERLDGITMHEHSEPALLWAQQLAKDLRIAVEALEKLRCWEIADEALRQIEDDVLMEIDL